MGLSIICCYTDRVNILIRNALSSKVHGFNTDTQTQMHLTEVWCYTEFLIMILLCLAVSSTYLCGHLTNFPSHLSIALLGNNLKMPVH